MVRQARARGADESKRETDLDFLPIVDQRQFRNLEVGVGYQAKHVVRQPQVERQQREPLVDDREAVVERTKRKKEKKKKKKKKKSSSSKRKKDDSDSSDSVDEAPVANAPAADDGPRDDDLEWDLPRKLARFEDLVRQRISRQGKKT